MFVIEYILKHLFNGSINNPGQEYRLPVPMVALISSNVAMSEVLMNRAASVSEPNPATGELPAFEDWHKPRAAEANIQTSSVIVIESLGPVDFGPSPDASFPIIRPTPRFATDYYRYAQSEGPKNIFESDKQVTSIDNFGVDFHSNSFFQPLGWPGCNEPHGHSGGVSVGAVICPVPVRVGGHPQPSESCGYDHCDRLTKGADIGSRAGFQDNHKTTRNWHWVKQKTRSSSRELDLKHSPRKGSQLLHLGTNSLCTNLAPAACDNSLDKIDRSGPIQIVRTDSVDHSDSTETITPASSDGAEPSADGGCVQCGTLKTACWRRDVDGRVLCNACGIRLYKRQRPSVPLTEFVS